LGDALTATLVYDVGPDAGLGHRRRMEALALALQSRGVHCDLRPVETPIRAEIIVVDSYRIRADDRSRVSGRVVAAVDDLARDLAVDLVVDPSPGATADRHPSANRVLAGAAYALLGPELACSQPRAVGSTVETVLVAVGGADRAGRGNEIAHRLRALLPPAVRVRLAVGPWSASRTMPGVEEVRVSDGLGTELASADLVVTAGGVTMVEALALGRPTVAFVIAENQRGQAEGYARDRALVLTEPGRAAETATSLAEDPRRRKELARVAQQLVDGLGADRVAAELVAIV